MIFEPPVDKITYPIEPCWEILQAVQDEVWQQSQNFSNASNCWNGYINRLSLVAVLSWLEELGITAKPVLNNTDLLSVWEVVNGTIIQIEGARLLLVPSTSIDTYELRVPQEWIDIPSWSADYYLAVQVNTEDGEVRIWGYTTHLQLKQQGKFNERDRTYSLEEQHITRDLNVLWVSRQLCPEVVTKAEIAPLPTLPLEQANSLLLRLGNPSLLFPRRAVPFSLWGALLEHGGWRNILYERRLGLPEQRSIRQWVQNGISNLAQQVGWNTLGFQASFGSRGSQSSQSTDEVPVLSRQLVIADQRYNLQVELRDIETGTLRISLQNLSVSKRIPRGFILRLLTEDLQNFEDNEEVAIDEQDKLEIEVTLEHNEGIVWEIEPIPDNYEREILRF